MGNVQQIETKYPPAQAMGDRLGAPLHQINVTKGLVVANRERSAKPARKTSARHIYRNSLELHARMFLRALTTFHLSFLSGFLQIATLAASTPRTAALANPADGIAQASPRSSTDSNHSDLGGVDIRSSGDDLHKAYRIAMAIKSFLTIVVGLISAAWILIARNRPPEEQRLLWLMTFGASTSWWVASATANGPSDGKSVSISTWLALFSVCEAKAYRGLRNGKWHLFTSLIGGLIVTMFVGMGLMGNADTPRPRKAMEEFVWQAVIVGPAILTTWSCFVKWWCKQIEQNSVREEAILSEQGEAVELEGL